MLADGGKDGRIKESFIYKCHSRPIQHVLVSSFPSRELGRCVHLSPKGACNMIQNGVYAFRPCNPKYNMSS